MTEMIERMKNKALYIRRKTVEMCHHARMGHIAPVFSCAEILAALYYGDVMVYRPGEPDWEGRDIFVMSKGQACAGLYAILGDIGHIPMEELDEYGDDGSRLGGHADSGVPGVDFYTGSLGHGLGVAAGMAQAMKIKGDKKVSTENRRRVFCLLGDGECQEGSVWEAAWYAAAHKLDNLVAIVDANRQQATDYAPDVVSEDVYFKDKQRWESSGWAVISVPDGHDVVSVKGALDSAKRYYKGRPKVIIANTIKGKGVPEIERVIIWHYRVPTTAEECSWFNRALDLNLQPTA